MGRLPLMTAARVAFVLAAAFAFSGSTFAQEKRPLTVFAAASLKNAIDEINDAWTKRTGVTVRTSYAASPALAKQIEEGAPADLFFSADLDWMDYVEKKNLVRAGTRQSLLGNTIVLIAPKGWNKGEVKIGPNFPLADLLGDGRLSVAAVATVPAGRYAKASLEKLGVWSSVEKKLAEAENVRAALAFVARGEAPLGIVYSTDAASEPNVVIVGRFPADSHPSIVYPVGVLNSSKHPEAESYRKYLTGPDARKVFEKHGFAVNSGASST
jgi:molybdate transport system substrate-binding protein